MSILTRIEEALEAIRPAIQMDGGNIEVVDFDEGTGMVSIKMMGACHGCPMSMMTLKMGIERALRSQVPEVKTVQAI